LLSEFLWWLGFKKLLLLLCAQQQQQQRCLSRGLCAVIGTGALPVNRVLWERRLLLGLHLALQHGC
jgi:hypothetical protein